MIVANWLTPRDSIELCVARVCAISPPQTRRLAVWSPQDRNSGRRLPLSVSPPGVGRPQTRRVRDGCGPGLAVPVTHLGGVPQEIGTRWSCLRDERPTGMAGAGLPRVERSVERHGPLRCTDAARCCRCPDPSSVGGPSHEPADRSCSAHQASLGGCGKPGRCQGGGSNHLSNISQTVATFREIVHDGVTRVTLTSRTP
jgi:hypothetical protein